MDELRREVELVIRRVGHWGPARWTAPATSGGLSRAETVHALVQRLADMGADAEGLPRRAVPRLDNDLALVDQLRVVSADLVAVADSATLSAAANAVASARAAL